MARLFTAADFDFLRVNNGIVTALPFTVCGWARRVSSAPNLACWYMGDSATNDELWAIIMIGTTAGGPFLRFRVVESGSSSSVDATTAPSVSTWHHCAAIGAAVNDWRVYLDGGSVGQSTTTHTVAAPTRVTLGRNDRATPQFDFDGNLAHWALWLAELSASEIASLAAGVSPLRIRRDALEAYWPVGGQSPEPDIVNGNNLTLFGTPIQSEEPPIPHSIVAPG